jgi:phospholipid transport system substrate-binding protein
MCCLALISSKFDGVVLEFNWGVIIWIRFGGIMHGPRQLKVSRRWFGAMLLGGFATGVIPSVAHADPAAEAYVQKIAADVMGLANSGGTGKPLRAKFAAVLNRYINLKAIATFALGTYQKQLPPGDKELFYDLVSTYSAALFVYYVDDFKGASLDILSSDQEGRFTTIKSAMRLRDGGSENIRWRLVPVGGGYKISDVNLKGVWLTISMKQRFKDVLGRSKGDFQALYDSLREAETW